VPDGWLTPDTRAVTREHGGEVVLSAREASLLGLLAQHPDQVFTRAQLLDSVFSEAEDEGVVDTYVHYLRRKLGRGSVATVRGVGYRLGRP
jgi:two-component system, OmpR family, response regulator QseB